MPKTPSLRFDSNLHFQFALCHRFFLPQPTILPHTLCVCRHHPTIDSHAAHLLTGCTGPGNKSHAIHSAIQTSLSQLFNWCGLKTKLEETGLSSTHQHRRPDITVYKGIIDSDDKILDVSVTSTLPGSRLSAPAPVLSRAQASQAGRSAEAARKRKEQSYARGFPNYNNRFVPLIFETNGFLDATLRTYLDKVLHYGSALHNLSFNVLQNYPYKWISVSLHNQFADTAIHRFSNLIQSHPSPHIQRTFSDACLLDNIAVERMLSTIA